MTLVTDTRYSYRNSYAKLDDDWDDDENDAGFDIDPDTTIF